MAQRVRLGLTAEQKREMWSRWKAGQSLSEPQASMIWRRGPAERRAMAPRPTASLGSGSSAITVAAPSASMACERCRSRRPRQNVRALEVLEQKYAHRLELR